MKVSKWKCKICQEQQSLKQVYASGSGAACRKVVQELNWKRMELSTAQEEEKFALEEDSFVQEEERFVQEDRFVQEEEGFVQEYGFTEVRDDIVSDRVLNTLDTNSSSTNKRSKWSAFIPPKKSFEVKEATIEEDDNDYLALDKIDMKERNSLPSTKFNMVQQESRSSSNLSETVSPVKPAVKRKIAEKCGLPSSNLSETVSPVKPAVKRKIA